MPWNNVLLDALLWSAVIGGFAVWAIRKEARRRPVPSDPALPLSHVRLAGETHRCANCRRRRPTMDLADGWGPRAAVLPYCGPCIRDTIGIEDAEGEVVA